MTDHPIYPHPVCENQKSMSAKPVDESVGRFFDSLTDQYTATIERCFPRYREMLWALLDYLPPEPPKRILELGCGTGNLSELLATRFPAAKIHFVDLSGESIEQCRNRLAEFNNDERLTFEQADFGELSVDPNSLDLVTSSISLHHLESSAKKRLFGKSRDWLSDGGMIAFADQFKGATQQVYERHIENWKLATFEAGTEQAEWDMWMEHQSIHDHHDSLTDQFAWLTEAGFTTLDCPWRYLLWAVVYAS